MSEIIQKKCTKCKEFKPATPEYFHRETKRKDGLNPRCRVCVKAFQQSIHPKIVKAAYRWRDANPDKAKISKNNWKNRNRERLIGYGRNYRLSNLERSRQFSRNWRAKNRERSRQLSSEWLKNNPIKHAITVHRRRTQIKQNGGDFTEAEWKALCTRYDYRCLCCKEQKPIAIDHIVPVSKGGSNSIDNIQPLCLECNSKKGTKTIDYRIAAS